MRLIMKCYEVQALNPSARYADVRDPVTVWCPPYSVAHALYPEVRIPSGRISCGAMGELRAALECVGWWRDNFPEISFRLNEVSTFCSSEEIFRC